ncbi:MAG TPA: D-alanyl-D-alanine carboxypeptidase [Cyanobacteria bacterium UBA11370]|nr:D-alanyl-D-alanine carboxypeptidase [Cyanobacteria bacterium UBA11370]HBY77197.1 D-alanyl-D-alanine carboxypeptidase [Cyanobacteria bacterium UBA11148]
MLQRIGTGLLASGLAVLLLKIVGLQAATVDKAQLLAWQDMPLFTLPKPDPTAEAVRNRYLQVWSSSGGQEGNQGVWMQSDLTVLAEHQGRIPLPAASLTKIATTLAALDTWGPHHQFETLVSATGPIKKGVLQGDLVITGNSDPLFIWEEAIALGNRLNQLGIRQVTGNLVIVGNFHMNFTEDPAASGQLLKQALNSTTWSHTIVVSHGGMIPGTPKPQVKIGGEVKVAKIPLPKTILLLRHQSPSLAQILREMNIYSHNALSEMLGTSVGGAEVVAQIAAQLAGVPQAEIQLINTSGLGVENRISPHAATAMLMAVERFLEPYQLNIADVFPLAGYDHHGTMRTRKLPLGTAMKTGTLREVSALAGVVPTRDRGLVWFAIINRGGNIWEFRRQQDQLLGELSQKWGTLPVFDPSPTQSPLVFGDPKRIQSVISDQLASGNFEF